MQLACVLLLALTLLQCVVFIMMAEKGVYHDSPEQVEGQEIRHVSYELSHTIMDYYLYCEKTEAREAAQNLCDSDSMSFVIKKDGKLYDSLGVSPEDIQAKDIWENSYAVAVLGNEYSDDIIWVEDAAEAESFASESTRIKAVYEITCNIFIPENADSTNILVKLLESVQKAYEIRYALFVTLFATLVAAVVLWIVLVKTEGDKAHLIDRLPFDVYGVCLFVIALLLAAAGIDCGEYVCYRTESLLYEPIAIVLCGIGVAACCVLISFLALQLTESIARRRKQSGLWKNTILYRVGHWMVRTLKAGYHFFRKNIPFIWKGLLLFGGITFAELVGIIVYFWYYPYEEEGLLLLGLVWRVILLVPYSFCLVQMKKLLESGKKLAAGDLSHKTDTSNMFWDLKKHGEDLNSIGVGLQSAVEDRMKSEHFKTELITNVSHDIKTPLTSIINYVDLLEKEELDNPKAAEYLDVLHRQSARLKKLIEDLIEASKASTGALSVNFEECEVGVLLTQAAGEFEEKLKAQDLTLLLRKPDEELIIRADGRHLWRVFDNLLGNIVKYAQPQTRVYLNLQKSADLVEIVFRNTSRYELNMTGEELKERFVRGDSSRNTEGNGLGLSIAQSLTELMGGTFGLVIDGDLFKVILTFPLVSP